jgi:hypothetical protein
MVVKDTKSHVACNCLAKPLSNRYGARQFVVYWQVMLRTFLKILRKIQGTANLRNREQWPGKEVHMDLPKHLLVDAQALL